MTECDFRFMGYRSIRQRMRRTEGYTRMIPATMSKINQYGGQGADIDWLSFEANNARYSAHIAKKNRVEITAGNLTRQHRDIPRAGCISP
jgi:hypothetical protein